MFEAFFVDVGGIFNRLRGFLSKKKEARSVNTVPYAKWCKVEDGWMKMVEINDKKIIK